ncbi:MAG: hypothetical protein E5V51_00280 [Mesorhizobium sp.]|nr:hypothetical protein EOA35_01075 [Mesorhizobium sp. M8A.F.Ca.ET.023.01.1.1]TIW90641.1 MAG: hypothetical protein E5V51_00280 [Mesorhizobium sp.]
MFTYETLKLGTAYATPAGELKLVGYGKSGDRVHAQFGDAGNPSMFWSSDHGFETDAQMKARQFDAAFEALDKSSQKLLNAMFGERLAAGNHHTLKQPHALVTVAQRQLVKAGKIALATCGRCGGCGRYSYNQMDGDKCYGCNGQGKRLPTVRECLEVLA